MARCAVTKRDLYAGEYNFLFGLAGLHAGVMSIARLQPGSSYPKDDDPVLLRRAMGVLTHELTHTFGLTHCVYFSCLMQVRRMRARAPRHPIGVPFSSSHAILSWLMHALPPCVSRSSDRRLFHAGLQLARGI